MIVSRSLAALALGAVLLTPTLASALERTRLSLNPADVDRDGVVSDAERGAYLGARTADSIAVSTPRIAASPPRGEWPGMIVDRDPKPMANGLLWLDRRMEPASEFEVAQEYQFQKAWDKKH
jgi:hypothetical protein